MKCAGNLLIAVQCKGRKFQFQHIGFSHEVNILMDNKTGNITGPRNHVPMNLEKEFDATSPYLYKAIATGQTLKPAELKWYQINDAGQEEVYFIMLFEGVKVAGVNPGVTNTKLAAMSQLNHAESVGLLYERITWHYTDGNIEFTDSWNEQA
ncbi:type VI secretion system tube protein TssD [Paraburkholderia antibiotica]|uniref:Type VI secretion system tube protein Hcp n=1 Tax=Paraburkholderia antibiotica TaxID=2728839 RepID=A0A7X9X4S1_9BURK|nr:type VI secretion system tube protein TssD [Paraburkholderia antibiotica]NML31062.1 type VI secretion system tube protein Hcp [Paraburkholderia antibiotica]